jgi:signal transduction histidine kinase
LRDNLKSANQNVASTSEQILQRVGADLHDGPAQQLSYALLRLSSVRAQLTEAGKDQKAVEQLQGVLKDTLRDVRNLSSRLQMPELAGLSINDVVALAIKIHIDYTETAVKFETDAHPRRVSPEIKVCVYRFVQEALTNAFKHAGGKSQSVHVSGGENLQVTVSDSGPGFDGATNRGNATRLGIKGMRARIEALGGELIIGGSEGAVLTATFPRASASQMRPET